jgi:hypothetical protein
MRLSRRIACALITVVTAFALLIGVSAPANAAWTELYNRPGTAAVLVCKKPIDGGGFGPLWEIHMVAASSPDYRVSATFEVRRPGSGVISRVNLGAANGAWDVRVTHASRILGDHLYIAFGVGQISTGYGLGQSLSGPYYFSHIRYC